MITFITVNEVNALLGDEWADTSKKAKSALMANAWLNGLNLRLCSDVIIPDDVKLAGAYAAQAAANGGLYQQKTNSGVTTSESVEADGVSTSETYAEMAVNSSALLDSDLQLAIALLRPYGYSSSQVRIQRG